MTFNTLIFLLTLIAILSIVVVGTMIFFYAFTTQRRHIARSLNMIVFRLSLPTPLKTDDYLKHIEMLLAVLSGLREQRHFWRLLIFDRPHISFEALARKTGIELYLAFPRDFEEHVRKYVYGVFPAIALEEVPEYALFPKHAHAVAGSTFTLKEDFLYPVQAHRADPDVVPLLGLLQQYAKQLKADESVLFQLLIRPEDQSKNKVAIERIRGIHLGLQFTSAIRFKASKILYQSNVRLLIIAGTEKRSYAMANELSDQFIRDTTSTTNRFIATQPSSGELAYNATLRMFIEAEIATLSTAELAPLIALPHRARTKLPSSARSDWVQKRFTKRSALELTLGNHYHNGAATPIGLKYVKDRRSHFYTIGQSGAGKSTLLANMIAQDMHAGHGVGVIDPHGDLIELVLGLVPERRIDDVIVFDPSDTERPLGINMLAWEHENEKDLIIQDMLGIFFKLFPPEQVGPIFEHQLRNIMRTLMLDHNGTLVDIPRLLVNTTFRDRIIAGLPSTKNADTDDAHASSAQDLRDFWIEEQSKPSMNEGELVQYLVSKLGRFTENAAMRNILGQPVPSFSASDVINGRKILLVNLSKGNIGDLSSALLGLVIVSKLQIALQRQAKLPEPKRPDFYLYIDEFQNFTTENIDSLLSEARKYHLNLHLAHQFIAQLPARTRSAIFGNVGTMAAFRVGVADAKIIAQEFAPHIEEYDLINANNYEAYVRVLIGGRKSKPLKIATLEPPQPDRHLAESIRQRSRLRYGRPQADVETAIAQRAKLA